MFYRIIRPLLFRYDSEKVHDNLLRGLSWIDPWIDFSGPTNPALSQDILGLNFRSPIGLAAGFDKNAVATNVWSALGFGFAEVGTVTPLPQEGNPKPRVFRTDSGIVNSLGFPSSGLGQVAHNLYRRTRRIPLGVNIGPNKDNARKFKAIIADLQMLSSALRDVADYFVVNLSSPNTPNLRENLCPEKLTSLAQSLQNYKPTFVKLSPDTDDETINALCDAVLDSPFAGVVATNTTSIGSGGLSGAELTQRANEVVRLIYKKFRKRKLIIASGGVMNGQDAVERIRSGANCVQILTGLVFRGPFLVKEIEKDLTSYLQQAGLAHVDQLVGAYHESI